MKPAALFTQPRSVYASMGLECWGQTEDARLYRGPAPVVAHPPCARWGRYWHGSPSQPHRYKLGEDGGCFAAALAAVTSWGGVLEHPRDTRAWPAFGIPAPGADGGWTLCAIGGRPAAVCQVDQGHYGHQARKPTWLLVVGYRGDLPSLRWGPADVVPRGGASKRRGILERLSHRQREATPLEFAELLVSLAARCGPEDEP